MLTFRIWFRFAPLALLALSPVGAATVTYTNGEINNMPVSLTEDYTFTIASGAATQNGTVTGGTSSNRIFKYGNGTLTFNQITTGADFDVYYGKAIFSGGDSSVRYLGVDGYSSSDTAIVEVSGVKFTTTNTLYVGTYSRGEVRVVNGGNFYSGGSTARIGYYAGGTGVVTVTGANSQFAVNALDFNVGSAGTGIVTVGDGAKISSVSSVTTNRRMLFAESAAGNGTLNVGAASGSTAVAPGIVNFLRIATGGGTGRIVFNHTGNGYNFTQDGTATGPNIIISGRTAVQVESGTTIMRGPNTYTLGTAINGGTLMITEAGGTSSVLGTGTVKVETNGKLGGVGRVLGAITSSGTIAPGSADGTPGLMTLDGGLSLDSTSHIVMEIGGTTRGTQFDAIDASGSVAFGGTLDVVFINGYLPAAGTTFRLFGGSYTGSFTFASILFSPYGYRGVFDASSGTLTITTVPEPSTAALLVVAGGLPWLRSRRRLAI